VRQILNGTAIKRAFGLSYFNDSFSYLHPSSASADINSIFEMIFIQTYTLRPLQRTSIQYLKMTFIQTYTLRPLQWTSIQYLKMTFIQIYPVV